MRIISRAYDETRNDFTRLGRFVLDDCKWRQEEFIWPFGRIVDWKYGLWSASKYFPTFFSSNAQLWFAAFEELAGLLISEIRECFHRLFANGIEVAYITGYSSEAKGLYSRLGAVEAKSWLLYERTE